MSDSFPSASPPVVAVERLTRRFGSKLALDELSLVVPRGGVFGLIGGNGAGKTTLLKTPARIAAGAERFGLCLWTQSGRAAGWRVESRRLSIRGSRLAQLHARRRADALYPSFLSDLG